MIMTIVSDVHVELLLEQKAAVKTRLQQAYRRYFARLAGQEAGEAQIIDTEEIAPLEAEFARIHDSLMAYVAREQGHSEATLQ